MRGRSQGRAYGEASPTTKTKRERGSITRVQSTENPRALGHRRRFTLQGGLLGQKARHFVDMSLFGCEVYVLVPVVQVVVRQIVALRTRVRVSARTFLFLV